MGKGKEDELNGMVQSSAMLLSFEGWIKYIEGFSRGLQTTKTVDALQVFDCVGEIMEYMKTLKSQLVDLLLHCEDVLEKYETSETNINSLKQQIKELMEENKKFENENKLLLKQNEEMQEALKILGDKNGKDM